MKIKYLFLGLVLIVAATTIAAVMFMGNIVKSAVHKYGTEVVGTNVELQGFSFYPLQGTASISGLTVANPQGYESKNLLSLGGISVKVDTKSIFENTIVIDEIVVSKPVITYEMISLNQNNIKQIQENVAKNAASAPKTTAPVEDNAPKADKPAAKSESSKNIVIKKIVINQGELKAVVPAVAGQQNNVEVVLPEIVLTDIGGKKKGTSIATSISQVLSKILQVATQTVVNSNLSNLKSVAKESLDNAVNDVKDKVKNIGIFGNL